MEKEQKKIIKFKKNKKGDIVYEKNVWFIICWYVMCRYGWLWR